MKKIFGAAALLAFTMAAHAEAAENKGLFGLFEKPAGILTEFDYNKVEGNGRNTHNTYAYVGLRQVTSYGTFNVGVQGFQNYVRGFDNDTFGGWQASYNLPIAIGGGFLISPSIIYGTARGLEPAGTPLNLSGHYNKYGLDLVKQVGVGKAVYLHTSRVLPSDKRVPDQKRYGVGMDFALTEKTTMRIGYNRQVTDQSASNGIVTGFIFGF